MKPVELSLNCICTKVVFNKDDKSFVSLVLMDKPINTDGTVIREFNLPLKLEISERYKFVLTKIEPEKEETGRMIREENE